MKRKVGRMGMGRYQRRNDVWAVLQAYMKASTGRSPSTREIKERAQFRSLRHVHSALGELEHDGLIRRIGFGRARSIEIIGARYLLPGETTAEEKQ